MQRLVTMEQYNTVRMAVGPRLVLAPGPTLLLAAALALGLAVPSAHAVDYSGFRVGAVALVPDFDTQVKSAGSVRLPNGEEENADLLLFNPRVTARVGSQRRQFSSTVEVQNGNYSAAGNAGYVDWKLENMARFTLDGARSIKLRTENFNTHEGAGKAQVPDEEYAPARFTTSIFDTSYEQALWGKRGKLVLDAGTFAKQYIDAEQRVDFHDQEDNYFGSSLRFHILPGANLHLRYREREIEYIDLDGPLGSELEASMNRREVLTYVGASWEPGFDIFGDLKIASSYTQTENQAGRALADTTTWTTDVHWQPLTASTVTFATGRTFREQLGRGSLESISSYRYNWEYQWARRLKTTLAGSYSHKVNDSTQRENEGVGFKLRFDYAYSAWVDMFLALGHDRRETSGNISFNQQTVMLGIAASLDRFLGR